MLQVCEVYFSHTKGADPSRAGPLTNQNKVCGILPRELLLPRSNGVQGPWSYLPFFVAMSSGDIDERIALVNAYKNASVVRRLNADGDVAIIQDPLGAHFALYFRTDDPEAVKPGTALHC